MNAAHPRAGGDLRSHLLRQVHAGARDLGMNDEARRAMQQRIAGEASCSSMNVAQLRKVVAEIFRQGWTPASGPRGGSRDHLPVKGIGAAVRAHWISLWHLGVVRDRSDAALGAYVRRMAGVDAARFCSQEGLGKALEGLKAWAARPVADGGAGVRWSPYRVNGLKLKRPRARVIEAQVRILVELGTEPDTESVERIAAGTGIDAADLREPVYLGKDEADQIIRALGTRVRMVRLAHRAKLEREAESAADDGETREVAHGH